MRITNQLYFGLVILLTSAISLCADIKPLGAGSYTTLRPANSPGPANTNGTSVAPKITSKFSQLPTTTKWWSSLIWQFQPTNPWSENIPAEPLTYKASAQGLMVCYKPTPFVTGQIPQDGGWTAQEYHFLPDPDLTVGIAGANFPDTRVDSYSDWAVTAAWQLNEKIMYATLVKGNPYAYFKINGGACTITCGAKPVVWYNNQGVLGITANGRHYGVFAPTGSAWTVQNNILSSSLANKNYCSVAALPNNTLSTLEYYRQHAYAYVTDTKVAWNYNETTAELSTTYTVITALQENGANLVNTPLQALYRHQWQHTSAPLTEYQYASSCGTMKVLEGNTFTTTMAFQGILPFLPVAQSVGSDGYNPQALYGYIDEIYKQSFQTRWQQQSPGNTYEGGKALLRIAQLIPLAQQVNHTPAQTLFLSEVKNHIQTWFTATSPDNAYFYYDNTWKTAIGYPVSYGTDTQLNDHHFHWGYFIHAAAIVALYDPAWASTAQWGAMVEWLINDANCPSRTNTQFPFLRHFDVYSGHDWANGSALFASGNNQESSSEAMNFATGVILWGAITGNTTLRNLGIYLYTTQTQAIGQYWFDVDNIVFPAAFNKPEIAIKWSDGGAYATWFGGRIEQVHGINYLPVTIGSVYLGQWPAYLKSNQAYMRQLSTGADTWRDIHFMVTALYDPVDAIARFNAGYTPEFGQSKAFSYGWVHTFNKLGQVDTSVTSSTSLYGVFIKDGVRTYSAYNPTQNEIKVTFSDATVLNVPARSLAISNTPQQPPVDPSDKFTSSVKISGPGELTFDALAPFKSKVVSVHYKINSGRQQDFSMKANAHNTQFSFVLDGLYPNDSIWYYFTYEQTGLSHDTEPLSYTYTGSAEFQAKYAQGNIIFTPLKATAWVNVHYKLNGGAQQSLPMRKQGADFVYPLVLKASDKLSYYFTYEYKGVPRDSRTFTYNT